jgi:hypothetical protein
VVRRHGRWPKQVVPPRSHNVDSGKFGRMFVNLPPFADDTPTVRAALLEVGRLKGVMDAKDKLSAGPIQLITDPALSANNPNNPKMTAGMTFLGQFVDHDISFDTTSSLERQTDPQQITNFRVPTLALDSVYGIGPLGSPHLYDQSSSGQGIKFLTEPTGAPNKLDVARNSQLVALIADPRNDENLIVSQLHPAFLRFHNNVVDHVKNNTGLFGPEEVFTEAQRIVRWHYQWILVHEFLELTCGATVVNDVLANGRKFYRFKNCTVHPGRVLGRRVSIRA